MRYEAVREMYLHHWTYSGAKDEAKVHEMYHDDAILEFPAVGGTLPRQGEHAGIPREVPGAGDLRAS